MADERKAWGVWWRSATSGDEGWCDVDGSGGGTRPTTLAACIEWITSPTTTPEDTYEIRPWREQVSEYWEVQTDGRVSHTTDDPDHAHEIAANARRGMRKVRLVHVRRYRVSTPPRAGKGEVPRG